MNLHKCFGNRGASVEHRTGSGAKTTAMLIMISIFISVMQQEDLGDNVATSAGATVILLMALGVLQIGLGEQILHSVSLTANGIDCIGDGFVSSILWVGLRMFRKPADERFHYGYYKIENLASAGAAIVMFVLATYIGYRSYLQLTEPHEISFPLLGIVVAFVAALSAWILGFYKYRRGAKSGLPSMKLEAVNTIKDGTASFFTVVALIFSAYGYPVVDAIAGFVIAVVIVSIGFATVKEAGSMLVDACDAECLIKGRAIQHMVQEITGGVEAHVVRLRRTGPYLQGELEIVVDESMTVGELDAVRKKIQDAVHETFPELEHLTVVAVPHREKT